MLEQEVDERTAGLDLGIETTHFYPRDPRYRKSGNDAPQPGDIARCGWVKQQPHEDGHSVVTCLMCARLNELTA